MEKNTILRSTLFATILAISTALVAWSFLISSASAAPVAGSLIRGSLPAVYYVGTDGKRYVFPNDKTYFSWYADFSSVVRVTDAEIAALTIGGNVTYRPGTKLIKIQSDPKVYAISHGGTLRLIGNESVAISLFGANWAKQVDDIADGFFVNYSVGATINSSSDFNATAEKDGATTISQNREVAQSPAPPPAPAPTPTPTPPIAQCSASCGLGNACVNGACVPVPGPSMLSLRAFTIDQSDVCFVGDAYTSGNYCMVDSFKFADNANLIAVRPRDKYLYPEKQTFCGRATLSGGDKNRIANELVTFANAATTATNGRLNVVVNEQHLSGEFTMSRKPGTCEWYFAPADTSPRISTMVDASIDGVIVTAARSFDFGALSSPDTYTLDQENGIGGTSYSYVSKEADNDVGGYPLSSFYRSAITAAQDASLALGISSPTGKIIGNYCRDGKKDFDETAVDTGGSCRY